MKPLNHPLWLTTAMVIMTVALVFNLFGTVFGFQLEAPLDWPADTHLLAALASGMVLFYTLGLRPAVDGIISHPDKAFWTRHLRPSRVVLMAVLSLSFGDIALLTSNRIIVVDYRLLPLLFALLANGISALRAVKLAQTVKGTIERKIEWIENYRL